MRKAVGMFLAEPNLFKKFIYTLTAFGAVGKEFMNQQTFLNNFSNSEKRVEGSVWA